MTTLTLMLGSLVRQYGWFWYCCISPVISATFRRLLKFIISGLFGRKSGLPSSVCSMLVKYMPADTNTTARLIELRFYVPVNIKTGNFGDILFSQYLGIVLTKQNLTQQKQMTQEQKSKLNQKNTKC